MKAIAIIPARGGSKRIPGKNIIDFGGRPMIAWTIQAALDSGIFNKVLVSTDSAEIAEISIHHGALVPFLRKNNADDMTPASQATLSSLVQAEKHWDTNFDTVVQLMPNCPLRTAKDIRESMNIFTERASKFQISVFRYGWMNPWWAMTVDKVGIPERLFESASQNRSQDLEALYCPTGAIWIAKRESLIAADTFYGPGYRVNELSWLSAIDIDDEGDLAMAQCALALNV
jgi:N-acylneuraminate cytidylyltransferase